VPWMAVTVGMENGEPVESTVNTDAIVCFQALNGGTWIKFVDGSYLEILDPIEQVTQVVLKADEKKAKNGLPTNQR